MGLFRCSTSSGGGGVSNYSILADYSTPAAYGKTHLLSDMAGKKVIVYLFGGSSGSSTSPTIYDGATTNDGSAITKLGNLRSATGFYDFGTFYQVDVKTNACTISHATQNHYCKVIGPTS
jgi:hypothetical protein